MGEDPLNKNSIILKFDTVLVPLGDYFDNYSLQTNIWFLLLPHCIVGCITYPLLIG